MSDNEVQIFDFEANKIRTVMIDGKPWFIAKDIASILDYTDTQAMTRRIDEEDVSTYTDRSSGQGREINIVNESGLYASILGSTKPDAKVFKKWITGTVLPSLRENGGYIVGQEKMTSEQILAHALIVANNVIESEKKLRAKAEGEVKMLVHDFSKEYTTTEIAKELHLRSARELNDKLSDMKIQFKQNGTWGTLLGLFRGALYQYKEYRPRFWKGCL
jgi:Prophage antirepressor